MVVGQSEKQVGSERSFADQLHCRVNGAHNGVEQESLTMGHDEGLGE